MDKQAKSNIKEEREREIIKMMPRALIFALVIGLVLAYYSAIQYNLQKRCYDDTQYLDNIADAVNSKISAEYLTHARRLAKIPDIVDFFEDKQKAKDNSKIYTILETITQIDNNSFSAVVSTEGIILNTSAHPKRDRLIGLDINYRPYIGEAVKGEEAIYPTVGRVTKKRSTIFAAPVKSEDDTVIGIVMLSFYITSIDKILEHYSEPIALVSPENVIFSANNSEWILKVMTELPSAKMAEILEKKQFGDDVLETIGRPFDESSHRLFSNAKVKYTIPVESLKGWNLVYLSTINYPYFYFMVFGLVYCGLILIVWGVIFFILNSREAMRIKYHAEMERERLELILENSKRIEASEERLRLALEYGEIGLWSYDIVHDSLELSDNLLKLMELNPEEFDKTKASFLEHVKLEDRHIVEDEIKNATENNVEVNTKYRIINSNSPDGIWIAVTGKCVYDDNCVPVGMHGAIINIDELTRAHIEQEHLQQQLRQAERLDSIGKLAGGVAHDFNNMLGGIIGAAELLEAYTGRDSKAQELNTMIIETAERAASLTKKLLAFSRKQSLESKAIDINDIIDDSVALLERTIDKNISIETEYNAEEHIFKGDFASLLNAFINLGINASHAMPNGGSISIKTKQIKLDDKFCLNSPFNIDAGKYIAIEFKDTGDGITPEDLPHIFEPFFTSKEQGKGTGLGLAAVYGTIVQHRGLITVHSDQNNGTCFYVMLPLQEGISKPIEKRNQIKQVTIGSGTVLLVDDEQVVRETGKAILEGVGYKVIEASNGKEGIEVFKQNIDVINIIVLDMVMPEMNGYECFQEIIKLKPDIKVILASGYTSENGVDDMKNKGLAGFIHKPYRGKYLIQLIHNILEK